MIYVVRRVGADELAPSDPGYESADLRRPQVLYSDWTPRSSGPHQENVEIFSNCDEVELLLNGKSLGSKPRPEDGSARAWKVDYAPGILKAIGRNKGKLVAASELRTAGKPTKILLSVDHNKLGASWDDVAAITVSVVDENGVPVSSVNDLVTFQISGPGMVAGVDNGDNTSHELFQANERRTYQGRCCAFIKATGSSGLITVAASMPGLKATYIKLAIFSSGTE